MTSLGLPRPPRRAGQALAWVIGALLWLVVAIPLGVAWLAVVTVLMVARPFLTPVLAFGMVGGSLAAVGFAWAGEWADAGSAALVMAVSGAALGAYVTVAEWLHPGFFPPPPRLPPWWWGV